MKIFDRIKAKTPRKDKKIGQNMTLISTVCGAVLATGLIVSPIGILGLVIVGTFCGGKALYHAQKVLR